jgi:hypothetical protein
MTSIKPPDGATGSTGLPTSVAGAEPGGTTGATVEVANQPVTGQASAPAPGGDALAGVVHALQAGQITPEQAVSQLVEHALSSVGGALGEAQRAELSEMMRSALANDPTLLALQGELGRR